MERTYRPADSLGFFFLAGGYVDGVDRLGRVRGGARRIPTVSETIGRQAWQSCANSLADDEKGQGEIFLRAEVRAMLEWVRGH